MELAYQPLQYLETGGESFVGSGREPSFTVSSRVVAAGPYQAKIRKERPFGQSGPPTPGRQSRAERALSLSETGARSRFSLSASASALNLKKRELEFECRPTERFARTLTPSISQKYNYLVQT